MSTGVSWRDILPFSGIVGILGKQRHGKSALAYHLAELRHEIHGAPAAVHGPPHSLAPVFPEWMAIVSEMEHFLRYPGHTLLLDEGSLPLHARQSLRQDHTTFDRIMSLAGQMDQLFIICTHHSRKLDINVITEWDVLAFKQPKTLHTRMERQEIREWSTQARDALLRFAPEERKRWSYVLYDDLDEEGLVENPLPGFWCDEISKAVSLALTEEERFSLSVWDFQKVYRELNGIAFVGRRDYDFMHRVGQVADSFQGAFKAGELPPAEVLEEGVRVLREEMERAGPLGPRLQQQIAVLQGLAAQSLTG